MKQDNFEIIKNKEGILAIIISDKYRIPGVNFFSPPDFPQQIGFMAHQAGKIIDAHIHKAVKREISLTQETLAIKKGKIRVDFYNSKKKFFGSRVLQKGDVILFSGLGGHGFKILADTEMVEIKQGPYLGKDDKIKFKGKEK